MAPSIDLRVEVLDTTVFMGTRADLAGPARAKLVVSIRNGCGWMLDVLRNGLVEAMHSSRQINSDEFCAIVDLPVRTSCTLKVACWRDNDAILSDGVVLRLLSGIGEVC